MSNTVLLVSLQDPEHLEVEQLLVNGKLVLTWEPGSYTSSDGMHDNAELLAEALGVELSTLDISVPLPEWGDTGYLDHPAITKLILDKLAESSQVEEERQRLHCHASEETALDVFLELLGRYHNAKSRLDDEFSTDIEASEQALERDCQWFEDRFRDAS